MEYVIALAATVAGALLCVGVAKLIDLFNKNQDWYKRLKKKNRR